MGIVGTDHHQHAVPLSQVDDPVDQPRRLLVHVTNPEISGLRIGRVFDGDVPGIQPEPDEVGQTK